MSLIVSGYNSVRSVAAYLGRNRPWLVPFRESENADEFGRPTHSPNGPTARSADRVRR